MFLASLLFDDRHPCDPRGGRKSATWWLIVPPALLGFVLAGCSTTPRCEELSRCGGDLLAGATSAPGATITQSEWVSGAVDACMDQVQLPIVPVSLSQQPAPKVGKKAPAPATVDWCSSLSQKPDGSLRYTPFFPIIPLKNAHLKLKSDGTYDAHFTAFEPQHLAFSAACRAAQGINVSCAELGRHIKEAIAAEANVYNTRCYDDSDGAGGCTCDYDLTLFTSLPGVWSQSSDGSWSVSPNTGMGDSSVGCPLVTCPVGVRPYRRSANRIRARSAATTAVPTPTAVLPPTRSGPGQGDSPRCGPPCLCRVPVQRQALAAHWGRLIWWSAAG